MKLVFASNNHHKIVEIQSMIPDNIEILTLNNIGCNDEIPETAGTIEGNAILKSNYVTQNYDYDCFADDTGLEVEALNGEPGVYSARYAGEHCNSDDNMEKLLDALKNFRNRKAQFKTVISLNINGNQHLFTGICEGTIALEKSGLGGFGYDPIFIPKGYEKTFAELSPDEKASISHRGKAVRALTDFVKLLTF